MAITGIRRAGLRVVLLALLVSLGMTVLSVVTELSRQSSEGLDAAIATDIGGATGSYRFTFDSTLGMEPSYFADRVISATRDLTVQNPIIIETLPAQALECPPFNTLGNQPLIVLRDSHMNPLELPYGRNLPVGTDFCIAGLRLDSDTVYVPSSSEQRQWGTGLIVTPAVGDVALLNSVAPPQWSFLLVTGKAENLGDALASRLTSEFKNDAMRQSVSLSTVSGFARLDTGGSVRAASDGITVVYRIIGWGTLLLAGIGLLVGQLILVSQRMWFFGLARALGASRLQIAVLVLMEVGVVLLLGTLAAVGVLIALQPLAAEFARTSFGIDAQLLRLETIPLLVGGAVVVLVLAGTYPAVRAISGDPLDVLEPQYA